jgi:hypothetical protein
LPTTVPLHRSRSLAASLPCRATGWLVCVCTCDRCPSVCTSLRCPPRLPETACYRLPAAAPPTRYSTAAFHATYLPPPNPTRLSTRLHQSTNPPSQPAIRYPGLSRRLPASHPSHSTQTSQTQPATQDPLFLPCFAFPRSPSTRGALPPSLLFLRVAPGGEPLHALLVTTFVQPAGPAGPEEIARLGRFRPTMRRANRVPVA